LGQSLVKLFRKEVLIARKNQLLGEVLLTQPFSYKLLSTAIIITLVIIVIVIVLTNGEYARREKVRGYITTDKGIIKVYPTLS